MLTSYADTTSARDRHAAASDRFHPGTANVKLQRRDNLDRVLVLSYTEFVRQPVRSHSCVKDGA
jgi:hypothetical protein